jgi:hypothetical protein
MRKEKEQTYIQNKQTQAPPIENSLLSLEIACLSKMCSFYSEALISISQLFELNQTVLENVNTSMNVQHKQTQAHEREQRKNELLKSLSGLEVAPDDRISHLHQFATALMDTEILSI